VKKHQEITRLEDQFLTITCDSIRKWRGTGLAIGSFSASLAHTRETHGGVGGATANATAGVDEGVSAGINARAIESIAVTHTSSSVGGTGAAEADVNDADGVGMVADELNDADEPNPKPARCAFSDINVHSRMPLDPTHVSLEANMRVTNGIPLWSPLLLPIVIINYAETLKVRMTLKEKAAADAAEQARLEKRAEKETHAKHNNRRSTHHHAHHSEPDPPPTSPTLNEPAIIDYLHSTSSSLVDDTRKYEHVWKNVLKYTPNQTIDQFAMLLALQAVNRNITAEDAKYCNIALGIADETSHQLLVWNFRLFCVLAALSERFKAAQYPGKDGMSYAHNAQMMELKISQARSLFYLSDGAKQNGVMTMDEFEETCLAGQVHPQVSGDILASLAADGKVDLEFLDFLAYLPVFTKAHDNMMDNILG
jgi:hypothetical protein